MVIDFFQSLKWEKTSKETFTLGNVYSVEIQPS